MKTWELHIYKTEYYLAIRKNEIFPLLTTWMDLEGFMLSEISQRKTSSMISLISKKNKWTNKLIDIENILMVDRWEGGWGMGEKGIAIKKYKLPIIKTVMGM